MVSANPRWNSDGSSADPVTRRATRVGEHPCEDPGVKMVWYRWIGSHCRDWECEIGHDTFSE